MLKDLFLLVVYRRRVFTALPLHLIRIESESHLARGGSVAITIEKEKKNVHTSNFKFKLLHRLSVENAQHVLCHHVEKFKRAIKTNLEVTSLISCGPFRSRKSRASYSCLFVASNVDLSTSRLAYAKVSRLRQYYCSCMGSRRISTSACWEESRRNCPGSLSWCRR